MVEYDEYFCSFFEKMDIFHRLEVIVSCFIKKLHLQNMKSAIWSAVNGLPNPYWDSKWSLYNFLIWYEFRSGWDLSFNYSNEFGQ